MKHALIAVIIHLAMIIVLSTVTSYGQTTEFTFQGRLLDGGMPANASYDMRFSLYDAPTGGNQIGALVTVPNIIVSSGIFTTRLDFGAKAYDDGERWLDISISLAGQNTFVTLSPRQKLASTPYAVKALNAVNAESSDLASNSLALGGMTADQFVLSIDPRMSDARQPMPGSSSYVQNQDSGPQSFSNFHISGKGRADIFDAGTQFSIGNVRILASPGTSNLFVGAGAGQSNTSGANNVLVGEGAGINNTTGSLNTMVGFTSGIKNTIGSNNAFFGVDAGSENLNGDHNTFIGRGSGSLTTAGGFNTFLGSQAGDTNATGTNNTAIGAGADVGSNALKFATAIGSRASVSASDTIVLGKPAGTYDGIARPADTIEVPGSLNIAGSFGANILSANLNFSIGPDPVLSATGNQNLFVGVNAGQSNTTGQGNTFTGRGAGRFNTTGNNNSFFGRGAGVTNTTGPNNSFFGNQAGTSNTTGFSNSFFGSLAGAANTTASANAFFGGNSGFTNTTGSSNAFFGFNSGLVNETGSSNAFFGGDSGNNNLTGRGNTFIGAGTGQTMAFGNSNTLLGHLADMQWDGVQFGTAIGANAIVGTNDTIVLGKAAGTYSGVPRPADTVTAHGAINSNTQFNLNGIRVMAIKNGPFAPDLILGTDAGTVTTGRAGTFLGLYAGQANTTGQENVFVGFQSGQANISGNFNTFVGAYSGNVNTTGFGNHFFGSSAGVSNTGGSMNSFFGGAAGLSNTSGTQNTFVGERAASVNTTGSNLTVIGALADVGAGGLTNATAIGSQAMVLTDNSLVLGSVNGVNGAPADTKVGIGTAAPRERLHVNNGNIYVSLGGAGLILRSPNGFVCVQISVTNAGALTSAVVPCP